MAKRRRYIHKYKDKRFTLLFYVTPEPYEGLALRFTDNNPQPDGPSPIGASFSLQTKDWIHAIQWYTEILLYIQSQTESETK